MERKAKGIWIPIEVWETKDLNWNEKVLLMEVDSFTSIGEPCFFSDQYIADLLGVGVSRAGQLVSSLIKKGYLKKAGFDGRHRFIETTLAFQRVLDCGADSQKIVGQTHNFLGSRPTENYDLINKGNKQKNKEDNNNIGRFIPPTQSEVEAYCRERGNSVDAQHFVDYYAANGWRVGRNPMKDWRAAVRTWESNRKTPNPRPYPQQPRQLSPEEKTLAALARLQARDGNLNTFDEQ